MTLSFASKNRALIYCNIFLFIAWWVQIVVLYRYLPGQIPMHFDLAGNVTRMEEATLGNWLLSPIIITMSSFTTLMLLWAFTTLGIENYNFPFKKEVLELSPESQIPFLRVVNEFLTFSLLGALLYMFTIGLVVSLYIYLHATGEVLIPASVWIISATLVYIGRLTVEYFRIKKAFGKQLQSI